MALMQCPECGEDVSDRAVMCPHCGLPIRGGWFLYEYRSKRKLFGLPLVHVVLGPGIDPATGRLRAAKGIIAIGGIAFGLVALGGVAVGGISLGGLVLGVLLAVGGCAIGSLALGGLAIGLLAVGGGAVGYYAIGGGAWGVHAAGGKARDPQALELLRRLFGAGGRSGQ